MTKVVRRARYHHADPMQLVSIRTAVSASCLRSDADCGRLEELEAHCEALADAIGVLAEAMLAAGLLNKRQLDRLVRYPYEVMEDDT